MYQRIGFQCLTETLFDDAGKHFFAGNLDPRVLIRYYPDLCGSLFDENESVDVFSGVAEHMPSEDSIDDISECHAPRRLHRPSLRASLRFTTSHPYFFFSSLPSLFWVCCVPTSLLPIDAAPFPACICRG